MIKFLTEKKIYTDEYAGTVDLITGIDDFEVDINYNEDFHTYKKDGKILPSVTQLLSDDSFDYVDRKILEYAQVRGTLIHKEIETWWNTSKEGFTKEFYDFLDLFYANKEMFENKAIWDYKTFNQNTPAKREKCYKQMKMYAKGIEHLTGEKITQFNMVWLPKDKSGKIVDLTKEFGGDDI